MKNEGRCHGRDEKWERTISRGNEERKDERNYQMRVFMGFQRVKTSWRRLCALWSVTERAGIFQSDIILSSSQFKIKE